METYGETLIKLRTEKGLSQEELADLIQVDISVVEKWESNQEEPTLSGVKKLSEVFGNSIMILLGIDINNDKNNNVPQMPILSFIIGIILGFGYFFYQYVEFSNNPNIDTTQSEFLLETTLASILVTTFTTQILYRSSLEKAMNYVANKIWEIPKIPNKIETKGIFNIIFYKIIFRVILIAVSIIAYVYMLANALIASPITYGYELLKILLYQYKLSKE